MVRFAYTIMCLSDLRKKIATRPILSIFLLALGLRLLVAYVAFGQVQFNTERFIEVIKVDGYYNIAVNLWQHGVFSLGTATGLPLDSSRTPGYPGLIFVSLWLTKSIWLLMVAQLIVASLLPVLVGRLGRMAGLPERFNIVAMLLLAIDPFGLSVSVKLFTETWFTLALLVAITQLVVGINRMKMQAEERFPIAPWLLAGFLLGVATLFRPTTTYLAVVLVGAWIAYRLIIKKRLYVQWLALFLVCAWLPIAPWMARNYSVFHTFTYSVIKEQVLYATLAPSILAIKEHRPFSVVQAAYYAADGFTDFPAPTVAEAPWFRARALATIKQYPREFLIVSGISVATFFTHDGALDLLSLCGRGLSPATLPHWLSFVQLSSGERWQSLRTLAQGALPLIVLDRLLWIVIALLFFGSIGYQLAQRQLSVVIGLLILIIAYFSFTTISNGLSVNARFRFPVDGLILLVIAQGYYSCRQRKA